MVNFMKQAQEHNYGGLEAWNETFLVKGFTMTILRCLRVKDFFFVYLIFFFFFACQLILRPFLFIHYHYFLLVSQIYIIKSFTH